MRPIGYYVHHHGSGHAQRFDKIRTACEVEMVPLSEIPMWDGLVLSSDVPPQPDDPTAGGALHWAPVGDVRMTWRSRMIGDWIVQRRPLGIVVDVSIEMALLCRLFGVPTVIVRQHGDRSDAPHEMAYRTARRLLAPFPAALEHPSTPDWVVDKTDYSGFVMSDVRSAAATSDPIPDERDAVVLWGSGGGEFTDEDLVGLLAAVTPNRVWLVGKLEPRSGVRSDRLVVCGWVDDVSSMLINRPIVVASAGNNTVADVARSGSPLVVVPQERPFREQQRHAEGLDAASAAATIASGSSMDTWAEALTIARRRQPVLSSLTRQDGAAEAARYITCALSPAGDSRE